MTKTRCAWVGGEPLLIAYHDQEWGVPRHDEPGLFEFLILEGAQAGLNWLTILKKREHYRQAFAQFDPAAVARFDQAEKQKLLQNPGVVRNRLKIDAAITNAAAWLKVQEEFGRFDAYIWQFVNGKPIRNRWASLSELPAQTAESEAMSKDLKKRGFRFVGPTICYAFYAGGGLCESNCDAVSSLIAPSILIFPFANKYTLSHNALIIFCLWLNIYCR